MSTLDYSTKFFITSTDLINVLCYPRFNLIDYIKKIEDLLSLDLKYVVLEGNTILYNDKILGKGCEGVVLKVQNIKDELFALKIRRTDSCRITMKNEYDFYRLANTYKIGPIVYSYTVNMLLMQFLEGLSIEKWFLQTKLDSHMIKTVVIDILNQCFILDKMNIDHGQLNKLYNHVIVSPYDLKCPTIDFESASISRRVSNLTSAFQGLFFKGIISKQIQKHINYENKKIEFLKLLQEYKRNISEDNFNSIISLI